MYLPEFTCLGGFSLPLRSLDLSGYMLLGHFSQGAPPVSGPVGTALYGEYCTICKIVCSRDARKHICAPVDGVFHVGEHEDGAALAK